MPRTCEQNLALRAWGSAHHRQREELAQLRVLVHHIELRPVYPRMARRAIQSQDSQRIAEALTELKAEIYRRHLATAAVRKAYPTLWPCLQAAA